MLYLAWVICAVVFLPALAMVAGVAMHHPMLLLAFIGLFGVGVVGFAWALAHLLYHYYP